MSLYRSLRSLWRRHAPAWVSAIAFNGRSLLSRAILSLKHRLESTAPHDDLYDHAYYQQHHMQMTRSAAVIATSIIREMAPEDLIEVGCGSGELLELFRTSGVSGRGIDYSDAALDICRRKGLEVTKLDLEQPHDLGWRADLVTSIGVAAHLPEQCADRYVEFLCSLATRVIVITAANPGQGGTDLVNAQPHQYWITKFEQRQWTYLGEPSAALRHAWKMNGVAPQDARNVLIFCAPINGPASD